MMRVLIFVSLLIASSQAFLSWLPRTDTEWDGLRARCCNPAKDFFGLPVTVADATADGWIRDESAGSCSNIAGFSGDRYRKHGDQAVMLLYDINGYISGMQAGIPKTNSNYPAANNAKHNFLNEETDMWVVTAYFTEPSAICTVGRTASQVKDEGMGSMLAFQTGPTHNNLTRVPLDEDQVVPTTRFLQGKCYPTMGMHYWYDISVDMNCDEVFPAFLLYNNKRLNGFGWAFTPYYNNSNIWEHGATFSPFIKEPPKCLATNGEVSTLHIYLTDKPTENNC